jgi:predicted transposase/invertase (TIGR01784 family)
MNKMNDNDHFIRFDWAMKGILRDKANFCVLDGLLTVLLKEEVHVQEILESEGNQQHREDKYNRVDIKAKDSHGDIILVEIQQTEEYYYLQRILYGVAKAVTEHITLGERYAKVKKVYSINIVYFDLGKGSDYLYHGQTKFRGVNTGDRLEITEKERNGIRLLSPENVFPEYYILRLKSFNKEPENPMEEWMEYLKSGRIRPDTTTPGLQEAKRRLDFLKMSPQEQRIYEKYLDDRVYEEDVLTTRERKGERKGELKGEKRGFKKGHAEGKAEGRAEGLQEGMEKGREEERIAIAAKMKQLGLPAEQIAQSTGIPVGEIKGM